MRLLISLIAALYFQLSHANTGKAVLNWAINPAPPFHVVGGPFHQQGLCDQLLQSIKTQLPELQHRVALMPQTRIHQSLTKDEALCFPCMIHQNQPTASAIFSQPTHWYRPQGVITRKELAQHLTAEFGSPLALAPLLASKTYSLGLAAGRRYGAIEPLLEPYRQSGVIRSGDDGPVALLKMIQSGRIDFTLDYDIILTYLKKTSPEQAKGLVHLAIAELPTPIPGAVGCSNSEWGKQQISLINAVLGKVQQDPAFTRSLELWFDGKVLTVPKPTKTN